MEKQPTFAWTALYQELADKLLVYRDDRGALISKLETVYSSLGKKMPKLDSVSTLPDIDPFTFFGVFNKGITDKNRIAVLRAMREEFGLTAAVPETFDGIPVLNNLNATYYRFTGDPERGEHDIDNLWMAFSDGLAFADDESTSNRQSFCASFDAVRGLKGNRWKLTMGLYWMRPYAYINLDSRNRWYIDERSGLPQELIDDINRMQEVPPAEDYLRVCEQFRKECSTGKYDFSSLPELSFVAWRVSQQVNEKKKAEEAGNAAEADAVQADPILTDADVRQTHYWLYAPGPNAAMWDDLYSKGAMAIGWNDLGDLSRYKDKDAIRATMSEQYGSDTSHKNDVNATWQFVHNLKPGDIVFAKKGLSEIVGRGVVTGDYQFDPNTSGEYANVRSVTWTHYGSWEYPSGQTPLKTFTDMTPYTDIVGKLNALFDAVAPDTTEGVEPGEQQVTYPAYTNNDFLSHVFMEQDAYNTLVDLVKTKKNVILQGAPGTGKTYCAKRLAYSMMGEQDTSRVRMVQFHQSYAYEDFIEGFRPTATGFELKKGAFYDFCKTASDDDSRDYFFIIDEINRGNLSKILGELFMLIEADKRGVELQLLYSDELFSVPENIHIIGTMNTADRSIAMMDYALRRRFAFFDLRPGFDTGTFKEYQESVGSSAFGALVTRMKQLNTAIDDDDALGDGFVLGHSFLCGFGEKRPATPEALRRIVDFEIVPLLKEYWFDDSSKVKEWTAKLRDAAK